MEKTMEEEKFIPIFNEGITREEFIEEMLYVLELVNKERLGDGEDEEDKKINDMIDQYFISLTTKVRP